MFFVDHLIYRCFDSVTVPQFHVDLCALLVLLVVGEFNIYLESQ